MNRDMEMAQTIAACVSRAGGTVYYVGGFVRDQLMHRENKDIDIEVHGITPEQLCGILDALGERTVMGASFGIYGLRHYGLDIAMPRRERATGRGHRDFEVDVDPFQGTKKAAVRRDFTINALMQNVLTGEIVDHFGGIRDMEQGVIRHVHDETFAEDPLRVLRAAQFAARFEFAVAEETQRLCKRMDLSALAAERVMGELEKALMKVQKPSIFFQCLLEMKQLGHWFPEMQHWADTWNEETEEEPGYLRWARMEDLLDGAAVLRSQADMPLGFMLSALCIAIAEGSGDGSAAAMRLLDRLTQDKTLHRYVQSMLELYGQPLRLLRQGANEYPFFRLFDRSICPKDLLLLARADLLALPWDSWQEMNLPDMDILRRMLDKYRRLTAQPFVRGADLVAAGFAPGPDFGGVLAAAHELHLSGLGREEVLRRSIAMLREKRGQ